MTEEASPSFWVYALFETTSDGMRLSGALRRLDVGHSLCPTPRHLSKSCGLALRFPSIEEEAVREAARSVSVNASFVRERTPKEAGTPSS